MSVLGQRLLDVHAALVSVGFPHAFGGAIALAYCTEEPRGTRDLDVNIFVLPTRADEVIDSLPDGVVVTAADRRRVRRDGQVRVWWDDTPVDLFFDVHDFHRQVGAAVRVVPFLGQDIPVLACTDLVVFKAMYDRTKDWADIEDMIGAGTVDGDRALGWLGRLLGRSDNSTRRLADILQRMGPGGHP